MKIPKMGNKGQFTIIALIMVFLTLVVFAVLLPQFKTTIDAMLPSLDSFSYVLAQFMIPIIFLAIVLSIMYYIRPVRD